MASTVPIEKCDLNIPNKLAFVLYNVFTEKVSSLSERTPNDCVKGDISNLSKIILNIILKNKDYVVNYIHNFIY